MPDYAGDAGTEYSWPLLLPSLCNKWSRDRARSSRLLNRIASPRLSSCAPSRRCCPKTARPIRRLPSRCLPTSRSIQMATLRRQIAIDAGAATVWSAVRDFGAVHTRVAPGFLTRLEIDKGDRVVTFFNGLVARERLVTLDDEDCRLVYAVVE